jgi:hypothetical protein
MTASMAAGAAAFPSAVRGRSSNKAIDLSGQISDTLLYLHHIT